MRTRRKVVGLVSQRYAPAIGGVEMHVEMLARGLSEQGVSVEVITTDPTGQLPAVEVRDGVLVRRFPTIANDSIFYLSPSLGRWLMRNAGRYSVLHAHSYHTPLALQAAMASFISGVPLVLTPHYHGTGHSPLRRALHIPYRAAGKWLLRQASLVICMSETERQLLYRHFGRSYAALVIPNGVSTEELHMAHTRDGATGRRLVLAAGRLEYYKQTQQLIRAVSSLPPEYDVVVIGDGPARQHIQQLIQRLGVAGRATMLGYVSRADLLDWYATADVFVSLSQHEAFGITLLEAALSGAAIVASDIPAHREVARFVPSDRVSFVDTDCSPARLAKFVVASAQDAVVWKETGEDNTERAGWRVPTWRDTVDGALMCYRRVWTGSEATAGFKHR